MLVLDSLTDHCMLLSRGPLRHHYNSRLMVSESQSTCRVKWQYLCFENCFLGLVLGPWQRILVFIRVLSPGFYDMNKPENINRRNYRSPDLERFGSINKFRVSNPQYRVPSILFEKKTLGFF